MEYISNGLDISSFGWLLYLCRWQLLAIQLLRAYIPTAQKLSGLWVLKEWAPPGLWHHEEQWDPPTPSPQYSLQEGAPCSKNNLTTDTTISHTNGLNSFTHVYTKYSIKCIFIETAIMPYTKQHGPFSKQGDSNTIIFNKASFIITLLTGGSGTTKKTNITYGTPYWWLKKQIKTIFPGCHLYQVIN